MGQKKVFRLSDFQKHLEKSRVAGGPTTAEGLKLLKAFLKIRNPVRRAAVIAMVEEVANQPAAPLRKITDEP